MIKVKSIEKNNARGGYNVGDATSQAATTEQQQYQMVINSRSSKYHIYTFIVPIRYRDTSKVDHQVGNRSSTSNGQINTDVVVTVETTMSRQSKIAN